jgi:2-polyprenyl-3-methyl-5-hydroxy-6-metoxy-1,4-benzoquinol methylase
MKCRLCFKPLNVDIKGSEELSIEDFYITQKSLKKVSLTECNNCGLVQVNNLIPQEKLLECYESVEDMEVEKEFSGRKLAFIKDIKKCMSFIDRKSNVLEIGAFTGIAAEALKETLPGINYMGIEPNLWACKVAKKRGQNVIQGRVGDPLEKIYDLVFAWDVIEHLENPHDIFLWCNELTKPGACLFINTPNWGSILRKMFGKKWWFIEPMHRTYFTPQILKKIALEHQWKMIKIWRHTKILSLPYMIQRTLSENFNIRVNTFKWLPKINISLYMGQMSALFKRV